MSPAPTPRAIEAIAECCALLRMPRPTCEDWLRRRLSGGPKPVFDVWAAGLAAGFDDRELDEAARGVGVHFIDGDRWRLP